MQDYKEFLAEILIDEDSLKRRTAELGTQISADYPDGNLLLICILRGGVPFLVDLSRRITSPHAMDFIAVSSYGIGKRESSGTVRVSLDLCRPTSATRTCCWSRISSTAATPSPPCSRCSTSGSRAA